MDNLSGTDIKSMLAEMKMLANESGGNKCVIIEDRTKAIEYAWQLARKGDQVAITGKGRRYQQTFALPSNTDPDTIQYLLNKS